MSPFFYYVQNLFLCVFIWGSLSFVSCSRSQNILWGVGESNGGGPAEEVLSRVHHDFMTVSSIKEILPPHQLCLYSASSPVPLDISPNSVKISVKSSLPGNVLGRAGIDGYVEVLGNVTKTANGVVKNVVPQKFKISANHIDLKYTAGSRIMAHELAHLYFSQAYPFIRDKAINEGYAVFVERAFLFAYVEDKMKAERIFQARLTPEYRRYYESFIQSGFGTRSGKIYFSALKRKHESSFQASIDEMAQKVFIGKSQSTSGPCSINGSRIHFHYVPLGENE